MSAFQQKVFQSGDFSGNGQAREGKFNRMVRSNQDLASSQLIFTKALHCSFFVWQLRVALNPLRWFVKPQVFIKARAGMLWAPCFACFDMTEGLAPRLQMLWGGLSRWPPTSSGC